MPKRIQLKRTKGWRLQEIAPGAVKVDRSTKWGNPFKVGQSLDLLTRPSAVMAVESFRNTVLAGRWGLLDFTGSELAQLRGKDLACWCRPGEPCHADVLIEFANRPVAAVPDV